MKYFIPLLIIIVLVGCSKSGSKPDPTPPPAKPSVKFVSAEAYSPNISGTPVTGTGFNITATIPDPSAVDSIVLVDETRAYTESWNKPKTGNHKIYDFDHSFTANADSYHLSIYYNGSAVVTTPSFTAN